MVRDVLNLYLIYRFGPLILLPMLVVFAIVVVLLNPLRWIVLAAAWLLTAAFDGTRDAATRDGDEGDPEPVRTTSTT